jgi:uncharacterized surface protein with fasciclin (FAS1) repeats
MKSLSLIVLATVAMFAANAEASSCGSSHSTASAKHEHATAQKDIIDTALSAGNFSTLAAALTEADLVSALRGDGPFTVFAPTDDAFAKLPKGTVESLLKPENRDQLVAVLTFHVVDDRLDANRVKRPGAAPTLNGQQLSFLVEGGSVSVNNAMVTAVDIEASNGIIHVIDSVLLPESETIVGVAGKAGTFNTLLAAVKAAGLSDTLMGEGPFTVFAPTDDAFAKLPAGAVESLLEKENLGKLQSILKYHVASGRAFAADVVNQSSIGTLGGQQVAVSLENGVARVNESKIVATDINASNGVIHVIESVLLPPEKHSSAPSPDHDVEMAVGL